MAGESDPTKRRSARAFQAFGWYLHWYFYRRFSAVRMSRAGLPAVPANRPLIIYSNHPSWWDPALYMLLCAKLFPGRPGYGPMDSAALGKYGFFERMGVFGIDLGSPRGAARFLASSLRVLSHPESILWITAEGHFTDPRQRPVRLRAGIAHLARRVPDAIILPLAVEYSFWNESKPEALVRFGPPIEAGVGEAGLGKTGFGETGFGETGRGRTVAEWTEHLEGELTRAMDALSTDSMRRDPALFRPLLRGSAGVGGIYDLYRRSRALAAGRRFDPTHEGREQ